MKRTCVVAAVLVGSLAASGSAVAAPPLPAPAPCSGCWRPGLVTSWQWQLQGTIDQSVNAQMYDVDLFDVPASTVAALHAKGRRVVCYVSAGSYENWRPDAGTFPAALLGSSLDGWAGERWLDVRDVQAAQSALAGIMRSRLDLCRSKGFDAVELDNVDGYTNGPGFPITAADQAYYNAWLANEAHYRGLSAALKNDIEQIPALLPYFDFAINEQCFQYRECTTAENGAYGYDQFVRAGKAVFGVEYRRETSTFCSKANALNFNWLKKRASLNKTRTACR